MTLKLVLNGALMWLRIKRVEFINGGLWTAKIKRSRSVGFKRKSTQIDLLAVMKETKFVDLFLQYRFENTYFQSDFQFS